LFKPTIFFAFLFLTQFALAQSPYQNPIPKLYARPLVKYRVNLDAIKIDTNFISLKNIKKSPKNYWTKKNTIGVDASQVSFVNWNAGGNNAVSGLVKTLWRRTYKRNTLMWNNEIVAKYGLSKQQDTEGRKTDDQLKINSTIGYHKDSVSSWYYSLKFNFKTQFTNGYKYPDISSPISRFMAPGYVFLGVGAEFEPSKKFSLFLSPVTQKSTFVLDQELANSGSFGVEKGYIDENGTYIKGKNVRTEIGFLITHEWETKVYENIVLSSRSSIYSDYLNDFGNIDLDLETVMSFVVNEYVKASFSTHFLYDNDVKFKEDTNSDGTLETLGSRLQLKQLLAIGLVYDF
jgi:hypothetical protein